MVSENEILPVLRKIDSYYVNRNITSDEADDLTNSIVWLVGGSVREPPGLVRNIVSHFIRFNPC